VLAKKSIIHKFSELLHFCRSFISARFPTFVFQLPNSIFFFILISLLYALCPLPLSVAHAAQVNLEWDPNAEPDLAGYRIHWGSTSGSYTFSMDVGNNTTCTITDLEEGQTYYFAATAYDSADDESDFSSEVSYTVPVSDSDQDGVPDNQDDFPWDPAETTDTDGDSLGDNADPDDDNDGIPDVWELQYGLNPLVDDASEDADNDGISNHDEFLAATNPLIPGDNLQPDPPDLLSPSDNTLVPLTPLLQTSAFYDPDFEDLHAETQWQIYRQSDNVCVLNIISANSLTALEVPRLILDEATTYFWRARFLDRHGVPSEWSDEIIFETETNPEDINDDGIPDHQEMETPSDLDGNGVWDMDQSAIMCLKTLDGKALAVSFNGSDTVLAIESVSLEEGNIHERYANAAHSPQYLPFGLINFKLIMDQPGDPAEITIYFSEELPAKSRWYKYDSVEDSWMDHSDYAQFSANRRSITLVLEDGGVGDADGSVNGIIVDPSGVGLLSLSDANSSFLSGCFIATASTQPDENQSSKIWREIRGRELAIILVIIALLKGLEILWLRLRQK
jgi:chitinase